MRSDIAAAITTAQQAGQVIPLKIVIGSSTFTSDGLVAGSFSYTAGVSQTGRFDVGGCVVSAASFTLVNRGGQAQSVAAGQSVQIYVDLNGTTALIATMYVHKIQKTAYGTKVECYDKLKKLDEGYVTLAANTTYTTTQIINTALALGSISLENTPSTSVSVAIGNTAKKLTGRAALNYALQAIGKYGFITKSGSFRIGWYSTASYTAPNTFSSDFDYELNHYTGVQVDDYAVSGTTTKLYVVSGNSLVTDANASAITSNIYAAVVTNMGSFCSGNFSTLYDSRIELGDIITTPGGTIYGESSGRAFPVTAISWKGGIRVTYTANMTEGDTPNDKRATQETYTSDTAQEIIDQVEGGGGGGGTAYVGNVATVYTTDPAEFLQAIYYHADESQQGYPVQFYFHTNAPSGQFILTASHKTADDTLVSSRQTPVAINASICFDLERVPAGSGVITGHGYIEFARSGDNNYTYKYTGNIGVDASQTDVKLRLYGGFMLFDGGNNNSVGYYITGQPQYYGSYGPTITAANMSRFRGLYVIPQPVT
jgi:hypothetical protein